MKRVFLILTVILSTAGSADCAGYRGFSTSNPYYRSAGYPFRFGRSSGINRSSMPYPSAADMYYDSAAGFGCRLPATSMHGAYAGLPASFQGSGGWAVGTGWADTPVMIVNPYVNGARTETRGAYRVR